MKTYRFVGKTHHDVIAESLEEAVKVFSEMKQEGLLPEVDVVSRIEVQDAKGVYVPVDRPLRAGDILHSLPSKGPARSLRLPRDYIPSYANQLALRVILGPQDSYFTDAVLLDTYNPAKYGGTGLTFDWNIIGHIAKRIFLAGGINPG